MSRSTLFDDYETLKPHIRRITFESSLHPEYMENGIFSSSHGLLRAIYTISVSETVKGIGICIITEDMLKKWNITPQKLIKDVSDMERERVLLVNHASFDKNLYYFGKKPVDWDMLCLTSTERQFGASLILNKAIRQGIGEIVGGHYIVLPSSIHEVIIIRDTNEELDYFYDMLAEFNANPMIVKPKDVLCNTPFWCSKDGEMMMDLKLAKEDIEED